MANILLRLAPRGFCLLALTAPAMAHERWVRHALLSDFDRTLFETYNATNLGTLLGVLILAGVLLSLSVRQRRNSKATGTISPRAADWGMAILGILTGLSLLIAAKDGQFVAPDLQTDGSFAGQVLRWGGGAVGVLLLLGLLTRGAGLALLGLYIMAVVARPFELFDGSEVSLYAVLNYLDVIGLAIFFAMLGRGALSLDRQLLREPRPTPERRASGIGLMRILLGGTLILLGLQKFFLPELPMGVVQNYKDQIYEPLARLTGATPEVYVFAASVVETTVGVVVLMGIFTRLWIAIVTGLFLITAVIFQTELLGHLPFVGMAVVLLLEGGGGWRLDDWLANRAARVGVPLAASSGATLLLLVMGLLFLPACGDATALDGESAWPTSLAGLSVVGEQGRCRFELDAAADELVLNEFFTIKTRVFDAKTDALLGEGVLHVDASMPEHGHGMATQPRTLTAEAGAWETEGCKLHMYGHWQLELEWKGAQSGDRASVDITFNPPPRG